MGLGTPQPQVPPFEGLVKATSIGDAGQTVGVTQLRQGAVGLSKGQFHLPSFVDIRQQGKGACEPSRIITDGRGRNQKPRIFSILSPKTALVNESSPAFPR